jgi:hypothetical protein
VRAPAVISAAVAVGLASTGLLCGAASPATAASGCLKSVIEYTGYRGPNTYQTVTKGSTSASTCRDLNVIESLGGSSGERYAGFYKSSSGWHIGTRGYVSIGDGTHNPWVVLLSDVKGGTPMSVGTYNREGAWVYLAY